MERADLKRTGQGCSGIALPYTIHADMQSRGRRCNGAAMELPVMVRFSSFENLLCQVEFCRTVQPGTDWWEQRCEKWTHWDLNPGPSACEADVIPLHHVPRVSLQLAGRAKAWRVPASSKEPGVQSLVNLAGPPEWKIFWDVEVASGIALVSLSPAPDFHNGRDNSVGRASD